MKGAKPQKGRFKFKGAGILKGKPSKFNSIEAFVSHPQKHKSPLAQECNSSNPSTGESNRNEDADKNRAPVFGVAAIRLHVHIRKDLADQMLDAVFERKKNPAVDKKDASQRMIIEEALEAFFQKRWNELFSLKMFSLAIPQIDGLGIHSDSFEAGIPKIVSEYIRKKLTDA